MDCRCESFPVPVTGQVTVNPSVGPPSPPFEVSLFDQKTCVEIFVEWETKHLRSWYGMSENTFLVERLCLGSPPLVWGISSTGVSSRSELDGGDSYDSPQSAHLRSVTTVTWSLTDLQWNTISFLVFPLELSELSTLIIVGYSKSFFSDYSRLVSTRYRENSPVSFPERKDKSRVDLLRGNELRNRDVSVFT